MLCALRKAEKNLRQEAKAKGKSSSQGRARAKAKSTRQSKANYTNKAREEQPARAAGKSSRQEEAQESNGVMQRKVPKRSLTFNQSNPCEFLIQEQESSRTYSRGSTALKHRRARE